MSQKVSSKNSYDEDLIESFEIKDPNDSKLDETKRYRNQYEFYLSLLGYAVGLGNIWRFPYVLYSNGGGVFFIPFIISIVFIILPMFYIEISYGQVYRRKVYNYFSAIHPRFLALSFGVSINNFYITVYFNVIIAW